MKIGVFAYNFPHWKTQEGIHNLILNGFKPDIIFAADPVKLNFYQSKVRISPKDLYLTHPKDIAETHNIPYHVTIHNSEETKDLIQQYDLDVGIILGSRILKPIVIDQFKVGILNMHPGILPDNRGLDNLKWALINDHKQGVTTHLIDSKIDMGSMIEQEFIQIYKDDTLLDLHLRIQSLEQRLMISSLKALKEPIKFTKLSSGNYYKSVPEEIEQKLHLYFYNYKQKYGE